MNLSDFRSNGFIINEISSLKEKLLTLRRDVFEVFTSISLGNKGPKIVTDADIIEFHKGNQPQQFMGVKHLWGLPSLWLIAGDPLFPELLKQVGLEHPILEVPPLLRCDMPIEGQSIFQQHQDYPYNIGSANSVTLWIPLQDTGEKEGALLVAPGTHTQGIFPNSRGIITAEHDFEFESCSVKMGEVLIFDQKLVHQSGFNRSDQIRFSIQLRFSDLRCPEYTSRGFPINHKITTEAYAGEVSVKTA